MIGQTCPASTLCSSRRRTCVVLLLLLLFHSLLVSVLVHPRFLKLPLLPARKGPQALLQAFEAEPLVRGKRLGGSLDSSANGIYAGEMEAHTGDADNSLAALSEGEIAGLSGGEVEASPLWSKEQGGALEGRVAASSLAAAAGSVKGAELADDMEASERAWGFMGRLKSSPPSNGSSSRGVRRRVVFPNAGLAASNRRVARWGATRVRRCRRQQQGHEGSLSFSTNSNLKSNTPSANGAHSTKTGTQVSTSATLTGGGSSIAGATAGVTGFAPVAAREWPPANEVSARLERRNRLPPRNSARHRLADERVVIVLYVHNRPRYLQLTLEGLSRVAGISETLLVVSHDGFYEEMDELVRSIAFCQVKQIYSPFSPHLFVDEFPARAPGDCKGNEALLSSLTCNCTGEPDAFGNFRNPKMTSLKHHWWWMMNTVWDGLPETRGFRGHLLFLEEDHFLFPNALRTAQRLAALQPVLCPACVAVALAPSDVSSAGEREQQQQLQQDKEEEEGGKESFVVERLGNVGYAFNRSTWERLHDAAEAFCTFDDYNWDVTLAAAVTSTWRSARALRWSRTSALHIGRCGLHHSSHLRKGRNHQGCDDGGGGRKKKLEPPRVSRRDASVRLVESAKVRYLRATGFTDPEFSGYGGWGDQRDRDLCLHFSRMYRSVSKGLQS
eukprot:jgi/Mesen1/8316/ME000457S07513